MLTNDLIRHRVEFARAIDNHQYEVGPAGIVFPKQRAIVAGSMAHHSSSDGLGLIIDPNIVPLEALNYLLKAGVKNSGGLATWYVAPFLNNIDPLSTITAATFDGVLLEFRAYDEASRVAWTVPTDPTAGAYTNAASPATFTGDDTIDPDDGVDIYGAAILSAATKGATTGKIFAASLFSRTRNIGEGDKLVVEYSVTATSTT
jgi:hypothetical protein